MKCKTKVVALTMAMIIACGAVGGSVVSAYGGRVDGQSIVRMTSSSATTKNSSKIDYLAPATNWGNWYKDVDAYLKKNDKNLLNKINKVKSSVVYKKMSPRNKMIEISRVCMGSSSLPKAISVVASKKTGFEVKPLFTARMFLNYCARQAGISTKIISDFDDNATDKNFKSNRLYNNTMPVQGDFVVFKSTMFPNANRRDTNHDNIEYVMTVNGSTFVTIGLQIFGSSTDKPYIGEVEYKKDSKGNIRITRYTDKNGKWIKWSSSKSKYSLRYIYCYGTPNYPKK